MRGWRRVTYRSHPTRGETREREMETRGNRKRRQRKRTPTSRQPKASGIIHLSFIFHTTDVALVVVVVVVIVVFVFFFWFCFFVGFANETIRSTSPYNRDTSVDHTGSCDERRLSCNLSSICRVAWRIGFGGKTGGRGWRTRTFDEVDQFEVSSNAKGKILQRHHAPTHATRFFPFQCFPHHFFRT